MGWPDNEDHFHMQSTRTKRILYCFQKQRNSKLRWWVYL